MVVSMEIRLVVTTSVWMEIEISSIQIYLIDNGFYFVLVSICIPQLYCCSQLDIPSRFYPILWRCRYLATVYRYQRWDHEDTHSFERAPPVTPTLLACSAIGSSMLRAKFNFFERNQPALSDTSYYSIAKLWLSRCAAVLSALARSSATVVKPMNDIFCSDCCERGLSTERNYGSSAFTRPFTPKIQSYL